jgi:signal transduction histidine kinase/GAF domain-containing protein
VVEGPEIGEDERQRTAAEAATLTARLAAAAARAADLAEKVAHVGAVVAREFTLVAVCAAVLDETVRTLGGHFVALHIVDGEKRTLTLLGERRLPEDLVARVSHIPLESLSPVAQAASLRRVRIISGPDTLDSSAVLARELLLKTSCKTLVALPLLAHDQLVGILTFGLTDFHTYTAGERATLDSCGHVFSFAVAHAMVYEEERRLRALFEAVGHATVTIAAELELHPSLQNIADEARVIADADYAALGIAANEDRPFEPWVFSGMTPEQMAAIGRIPRPVGTLGLVAWMNRPLRVADVRQHPAFRGLPPHHPEIISFLGVPISFEGRAVGTLYLANKRGQGAFSAEDQKAIELLAAHAGAVVHQRHLREELDAERARFKAIVENAPHGVVFVDPASQTMLVNPRARALAGDIFQPSGTHSGEILNADGTPVPRDHWPHPRAVRGETVRPQEFLFRHPDGRLIPVLISAAPVREFGPEATVVLFEDISVLKQLQPLREEWASVITHELRQPITRLAASIGLLRELAGSPDSEVFQKAIARTQRAVQSLTRLVEDLADVSQIETAHLKLERQPLELDVLARGVIEEQQARRPDRSIALDIHGRIPPVAADPVRIEQVFSNLITNALKYSEPNTPVNVEVRGEGREVRVLVTNRGEGIAPEELARIFDRFYRTPGAGAGNAGGLGLGLYVAKGIVEAHGGRIWAESRPGETTTVQFTIPVIEETRSS